MSEPDSYKLGRVLISSDEIARRVREVAADIAAEYRGKKVVMIGVLRGAVVFLSDLMRAIGDELDLSIEFVGVSSYGGATSSSGSVRTTSDTAMPLEGRHVLIVEDIVDSGHSIQHLQKIIGERGPASVRTCVFLDKPERRSVEVTVDHICFKIPNEFVVGYGLDVAGKWRQLPDVRCVITE